ncbi:hypothetical protein FQR65_LT19617 [Abscondita terminalis]|nr:hypothetical protein FQR65_LT19617 [Abscondita terminalis]
MKFTAKKLAQKGMGKEKAASEIQIPGFRPGKAPKDKIKAHLNPSKYLNYALKSSIEKAYKFALEQKSDIVPFTSPVPVPVSISEEKCELEFQFDLKPSIEIAKYKDIKDKDLKKETIKVEQEDIDKVIDQYCERFIMEKVKEKDAKIEKNDLVDFDFEGFVDGKAFKGGKGLDFKLVIGSGKFIPGFEDQMIGKSLGESTIEVTFPEDYTPELSNKKAEFKLKIKEIKQRILPEKNDELVKDLNLKDITTYDQLVKKVTEDIKKQKENNDKSNFVNRVIEIIRENSKIEIPKRAIDAEVENMYKEFEQRVLSQKITMKEYKKNSGLTDADIRAELFDDSKARLESFLVTDSVRNNEKFEVSKEEIENKYQFVASQFGVDVKMVKESFLSESQVSTVLEIGREASTEAVKKSIDDFEGKILITAQKDNNKDEPKPEDIFNFDGIERVKLTNIKKESIYSAEYEIIESINLDSDETNQLVNELKTKLIKKQFELANELIDILENDKADASEIIDAVTHFTQTITPEIKGKILEEADVLKRIKMLNLHVNSSINKADIEGQITKKIKEKVDDQQKDFYLREKLKVIKDELGMLDGTGDELEKYKKRLEEEPFPEHIKKRILSEIDKCEEEKEVALNEARKILDGHHFGLEKVKERIVEYLAVKQHTKSVKGQIITLVGPPGVGKTSLAKSIAEAMGRTFVKISLGGVRDESEIRGHRKTYVGSLPGRIIQGMKKAGVKNPVFLLDEIDKMSSEYKGDPASAMLEVLDPEQNNKFSDHYIEEEFDLSDVVFIATANYPDNIPEALYDRMEIIELSSYTEHEKYRIAKEYLVPNNLQKHNLTKEQIEFTDKSIEEIVKYYTREAGVLKMLEDKLKKLVVTPEVVNELLKKRIFEHSEKQKESQVGVVTGLAYTQYGGDILPIEVNHFPGKGGLVLTGKLGDVMKESATIAYDYVKSNYNSFGIPKEVFEQNDIHIHVPEGAVPKDGPSAGVTMATAIVSALTNRKVPQDIGMTGEITLRGLVFPIGGLKEKSIAAHRSGIKRILIPIKNTKNIEDIPQEVLKDLEVIPVEHFTETFEIVFGEKLTRMQPDLPMAVKAEKH